MTECYRYAMDMSPSRKNGHENTEKNRMNL